MTQQIILTLAAFLLILLAVKNSSRKRMSSSKKYLSLFNHLSRCLALYEKPKKHFKDSFALNVSVDYDLAERTAILKEIKQLHKFFKLIHSLNNASIKKDFNFILKESKKGETASLSQIKPRLTNLYLFLGRYLKRYTN